MINLIGAALLVGCQQQVEVAAAADEAKKGNDELTMAQNGEMMTLHDFESQTLSGETFSFADLKGKRVLIVNTASECGYTPQYKQLQELYENYGGEDFEIVGFPSNDFGGQEPGSDKEIAEFCQKNFGVEFPMMSKSSVTGDDKHPVYEWLTDEERNGRKTVSVQWNFNKFLVDEKGNWVAFYPSGVSPLDERIMNFAEGKPVNP